MVILSFLLNLPWTLLGLLEAFISFPRSVRLSKNPFALIFSVKSFWWQTWKSSKKGVRATTVGHVVPLTSDADNKDLAHELIHVEQFERAPLIQPLLYAYQSRKYGYRQNKYEKEAYDKSASRYIE